MNSTSTQLAAPTNLIYETIHQVGMWGDFKVDGFLNTSSPLILDVDAKLGNQSEDSSQGTLGGSHRDDQEASKPVDKVLRRLAQNREAARKSRLRKKAYVQQLESSKIRLLQLEQKLEQARQQNQYACGGTDISHPGIAAFEMDYGNWVEEQNTQVTEMRNALQSHIGEIELRILVDRYMRHYFDLFRIKTNAAKTDVFYLMSGMWKTAAERFFLWIGGFRPSGLLKVLTPHFGQLTDQQQAEAGNLQQSCQQAEDALSRGMEKLQQILVETIATGQLGEEDYLPQINAAMEKLEALVRFINQADHLRQETLQQMSRILTTRQAARCLLALGEYFERLRALSSQWSSSPRDSS